MSQVTDEVDRAGEGEPGPAPPQPGLVVTSHPLAVDAALRVLRDGGDAVDAAVCAAAVLGVVDPMSTGLGGDCFALVYRARTREIHGINGSGRAPAAASLSDLARRGLCAVPEEGILSVTVPGAPAAWHALVNRFGNKPLGELLEPAIAAARDGFAVTPVVARDWARSEERLRRGQGTGVYLPGGRAPREGERVVQADLAATLATVAREGVSALYTGSLARQIATEAERLGGWLRQSDLAEHTSTWEEPLSATYRGHPVLELPPNGQGLVTLLALRILDCFPLSDLDPVERTHLMIEAVKLAFADGRAVIGDPDHTPPLDELLDEDRAERQAARIGQRASGDAPPPAGGAGDTVYVAVVDLEGNACSLINSVYMHFGANVVVPGTGICLQNRGALFSADPAHPGALGPRRRPYHTIIPAMALRTDRPWLVFGVVGGFQQPQAQVQLLVRLIDLDADLQAAVDAPRFRWLQGPRVRFEAGTTAETLDGLRRRGHEIVDEDGHGGFGGAQAIEIDPATGRRRGATDPRKDGRVGVT